MKRRKQKKNTLPLFLIVLAVALVAAGGFFLWTMNKPAPAVRVYFFRGDRLVAVERPLAANETPLQKAASALLEGPDPTEKLQGMTTQLPAGVILLSLKVEKGTAILNFDRKLEAYGGGSTRLEGMIAQIVYTVTEIPGIEKAWVWLEGKKEVVLGGEGLVLDHPLGRNDISH